MKKLLVTILGLSCALALTLQAEEGKKKHEQTPEQKAVMKEMLEKYDTNKDGKLDKEEKSKISAEDKEKMKNAGVGRKEKKAE